MSEHGIAGFTLTAEDEALLNRIADAIFAAEGAAPDDEVHVAGPAEPVYDSVEAAAKETGARAGASIFGGNHANRDAGTGTDDPRD